MTVRHFGFMEKVCGLPTQHLVHGRRAGGLCYYVIYVYIYTVYCVKPSMIHLKLTAAAKLLFNVYRCTPISN